MIPHRQYLADASVPTFFFRLGACWPLKTRPDCTISVPCANKDPASLDLSGGQERNILGGDLWQCVSLFQQRRRA
jgi:hypothetical protein